MGKSYRNYKSKIYGHGCYVGMISFTIELLGIVGRVIKGSELKDALEQIFGKSTVPHLISGKAVSRVLCGHFLVE